MATAHMLVSVFFLSGALAGCPENSHLSLTAPLKMEALSGSCLLMPCAYTYKSTPEQPFNETVQSSALWIKNASSLIKGNVVFNSSRTVNAYPLSLIGDLGEKNCTTLFSNLIVNYTDRYFFRIENRPFKATACQPLQITVKDSPWRPRIEISGDVKEEESVTITCSALTPCPHSPPQLTWNLQPDSHNIMEENKDGTFTTKIQKTITLSEQHDGYNITCSARYPVNEGREVKTAEKRQTLSVLHAPSNTSVIVSPGDPVSAGIRVTLTCSCRANPPCGHFLWFRMNDGRLELIGLDEQVYSFDVTDGDRGRLFYCGCRNDLGIQLSMGHQLIFTGQLSDLLSLQATVTVLGIILLISMLIIFECWLRLRHRTKAVTDEAKSDYVNTVSS